MSLNVVNRDVTATAGHVEERLFEDYGQRDRFRDEIRYNSRGFQTTRCPSVPALDSDRMRSSLPSMRGTGEVYTTLTDL